VDELRERLGDTALQRLSASDGYAADKPKKSR
jgi:hypothetical protein